MPLLPRAQWLVTWANGEGRSVIENSRGAGGGSGQFEIVILLNTVSSCPSPQFASNRYIDLCSAYLLPCTSSILLPIRIILFSVYSIIVSTRWGIFKHDIPVGYAAKLNKTTPHDVKVSQFRANYTSNRVDFVPNSFTHPYSDQMAFRQSVGFWVIRICNKATKW